MAQRVLQFHSDQDEQRAVDDEGGQRPEGQCLTTVIGADEAGRHLGHDQAAHDDREDAGGVDQLGQQVRRERSEDHDQVAEQGVVQSAPQVHVDPGDRHPDRGPSAVGQQEQRSDVRQCQVFLADGDTDRQAVDDQCGAVVDKAFRTQHGDLTARQGAREGSHGGGVGGRHGRAQGPRRSPRQP